MSTAARLILTIGIVVLAATAALNITIALLDRRIHPKVPSTQAVEAAYAELRAGIAELKRTATDAVELCERYAKRDESVPDPLKGQTIVIHGRIRNVRWDDGHPVVSIYGGNDRSISCIVENEPSAIQRVKDANYMEPVYIAGAMDGGFVLPALGGALPAQASVLLSHCNILD